MIRSTPASTLLMAATASFFFAFPLEASAGLITSRIGVTADNEVFTIDLNDDGLDDFAILDQDGPASISYIGIEQGAVLGSLTSEEPLLFSPGDTISPQSSVSPRAQADLSGVFPEVGSTGFLGLSLERGDEVTFGFLEITRGSTILGLVGYQTTPGAGATIPVPEPNSRLFAVLASSGLLAIRRGNGEAT